MKFILAATAVTAIFILILYLDSLAIFDPANPAPVTGWQVKSVDTVKYSRDLAREMAHDPEFDQIIKGQVAAIASLNPTHIALGTPYDAEFVPFLARWVNEARNHNLKIWFRGNFAGWEGWFDYPKITPSDHLNLTKNFIESNQALFSEGDIFTTCTECENGWGEINYAEEPVELRSFLIASHQTAQASFRNIGIGVKTNYFPMSFDATRLLMDSETTNALGGVIVIDHYTLTPNQLLDDLKALRQVSGGNIVIGEIGAPVPDIHGPMDENTQADWLEQALSGLSQAGILGVNYWVSFGGSTRIFEDNLSPRPAAEVLKRYFLAP
jgi:hypothetical protein